jgi:hypothetical protein
MACIWYSLNIGIARASRLELLHSTFSITGCWMAREIETCIWNLNESHNGANSPFSIDRYKNISVVLILSMLLHKSSHAVRLRRVRVRFVAYSSRRQQEESYKSSIPDLQQLAHSPIQHGCSYLRMVVGSGARTRPSRSLPTLHSFQFRGLVQLHDAIDLAIRMLMILSRILLIRLHVDGGKRKEPGLC